MLLSKMGKAAAKLCAVMSRRPGGSGLAGGGLHSLLSVWKCSDESSGRPRPEGGACRTRSKGFAYGQLCERHRGGVRGAGVQEGQGYNRAHWVGLLKFSSESYPPR